MNSTPTPTPTPRNADLINPLVSERFTTDAVTGTAEYPADGGATVNAAQSALDFRYDASNGNYVVSTNGRSQNFGTAQRDSALSTPKLDVYKRTSGSVTDTLALRTHSTQPSTPDDPNFQYAGAGLWQRTDRRGNGISGTADAFTYGIETGAATVPVTGRASYAVSVNGVAAYADTTVGTRGSGTFNVDFATSRLTGNMLVTDYLPDGTTGSTRSFDTRATLASGANGFSGTVGGTGKIDGRFYGPNHEELGAAWMWRDDFLGTTYVGTALGKDKTTLLSNNGLNDLKVNEEFNTVAIQSRYIKNTDGRGYSTTSSGLNTTRINIAYSEQQSALVVGFPVFSSLTLASSAKDAALSDAAFDAYKFSRRIPGETVNAPAVLRISKPAASNPIISLSYTGFGSWQIGPADGLLQPEIDETTFAFGRKTSEGDMPRVGSANYVGIVDGLSEVPLNGTQRPYIINGSTEFAYDFANASLSGSMRPIAIDRDSGSRYDLGAYNFAGTTTVGSTTFVAHFDRQFPIGGIVQSTGHVEGQFTGPAAAEFMGFWTTVMTDPVNGGTMDMMGVMAGKQSR